jgi:hemoglobin-like flavoprotein
VIDFEAEFRGSYKRVLSQTTSKENEFFDAFYDRFIAASPTVAEKFRHTDMVHQKAMLKQSLTHLLNLFTTKKIPDSLPEIALEHSRRQNDIPPELYHLWLECLIQTVREFDPKCTDDTELAWRLVCSQGIAYMSFMYDR